MKTLPITFAVMFAASFMSAGPILTLPSNLTQQVQPQYEIVGEFDLQQNGNQITGDYTLTETTTTQTYEVINESGNEIVGEFHLTQTEESGSFDLHQSSSEQNLYQLVETGNVSIGTYTLDQGNEITGNYKLGVQAGATAPEPGGLTLAGIGAGCIVLSRLRRRTRSKQAQPDLVR